MVCWGAHRLNSPAVSIELQNVCHINCSPALSQAAASSRAGEGSALQDRMLHVCRSRATAALKESHANFGCFREPNDLPGSPEPAALGSPSAASQKSLGSRSFSSMRG